MPTAPSDPPAPAAKPKRRLSRNAWVGLTCLLVFSGMVGAAYASVPLYKAFCNLTGFDGTVRRAKAPPEHALERTVNVRFDANVNGLPWKFAPEQASQTIHIGDQGLAFFSVTNTGDKPMTGRAVYNVVPEQAGPYFQKLECFCFTNQTLQPGQTMNFPVVYFVDPQYAKDFDPKTTASEITLSYTFYPAVEGDKPQKQASAPPAKASGPLGGTARAGL